MLADRLRGLPIDKKPVVKRSQAFLLLELLIAIVITSMVIVPLLESPFFMLSKQINQLVEMELERVTDSTLAEIRAELYANAIPWQEVILPRIKSIPRKKDLTIFLSEKIKKKVKQSIYVFTDRKSLKIKENGEELCLVTVLIKYQFKGVKKFNRYAKFFVSRKEI